MVHDVFCCCSRLLKRRLNEGLIIITSTRYRDRRGNADLYIYTHTGGESLSLPTLTPFSPTLLVIPRIFVVRTKILLLGRW